MTYERVEHNYGGRRTVQAVAVIALSSLALVGSAPIAKATVLRQPPIPTAAPEKMPSQPPTPTSPAPSTPPIVVRPEQPAVASPSSDPSADAFLRAITPLQPGGQRLVIFAKLCSYWRQGSRIEGYPQADPTYQQLWGYTIDHLESGSTMSALYDLERTCPDSAPAIPLG